jgi:hypothetical protein
MPIAARWTLALIAAAFTSAASADDFSEHAKPLLAKYCLSCHGAKKQSGDVAFDKFTDAKSAAQSIDVWERALENLRGGVMPPKGKPQPTAEESERLAKEFERIIASAPTPNKIDPGRVTMRRLNRIEYNNTVRDLLGVDIRPADDFPVDDSGYGFDNIGDVLTIPPLLLEKYLSAAERLVNAALERPLVFHGPEVERDFEIRDFRNSLLRRKRDRDEKENMRLDSNGEISVVAKIEKAGDYRVTVRANEEPAGDQHARLVMKFADREVGAFDVKSTRGRGQECSVTARLETGMQRITAAYVNDYLDKNAEDPKKRDRNLIVRGIKIEGPMGVVRKVEPPEPYRRIMGRIEEPPPDGKDVAAASMILRNFAHRAFRRPVVNAEVDRLVAIYKKARASGDAFEPALKLALQAVLVSPHFLFRIERDRPTDSPDGVADLGPYEVASRLSYFLWSSMPDDELLSAAARGKLLDEATLGEQTKRMLADPKAWAFVEAFAGQWLQTRSLENVTPDVEAYNTWDEPLRNAMIQETQLFFQAMLGENRPIGDFLTADFTFVNERLAKHYGIKDVRGKQFQRVSLAGTPRAGLLTQASFLTLTSNPTRTSPVKRGKWILENLLNTPPPPPPPDVPSLDEDKGPLTGTLRQKLEKHRENPVCNSCHQRMDPLGLAFENFDGIGRFRTHEGRDRIDAGGVLPTGEKFEGADGLRKILLTRKDQFRKCLVEKLLTFALGRGLEKSDRPAIDRLCRKSVEKKDRFADIILEVVKSEPFRKHKNAGETK